jgi:hypothetical protein
MTTKYYNIWLVGSKNYSSDSTNFEVPRWSSAKKGADVLQMTYDCYILFLGKGEPPAF